ncbi:hypothetical protein EJ05DRAFT_506357 [Pseudovirgaria hyperparasitica]|uniref:Zn(2)-C6 fungal-type domain-containing protein n=1 Tax=Pseudovirgaria hyperparasitica TaxID=470096 RepID=A0A6A6WKG7_9PEZI|nr:uncharacterized protein EJ05DRAFT_506357 [Pseudovirgaria hyperparasitica]KAF2762657.1 hypothetical protein EJ05DRAFT_506357 [Pseudovirgaria hyperparasitica]
MPGVPSSDSCDACRKQKKKCDKARPACSRCTRLGIPCIGAGVQRYKFLTVNGQREHGLTRLVTFAANQEPLSILRPPQNATTSLAQELVHQLAVEDVRFNLPLVYGPLIIELPRLLGQNDVLDASVASLVATVDDIAANKRSPARFGQYGIALAKLRMSLQDPEKVFSSLTLCAVYIVWCCQGWIGGDQSNAVGHGAGLVAFISRTQLRFSKDPFDQNLLRTLLAATMFEAAFDPSIRMAPWMKDILTGTGTGANEHTVISFLLNLPRLMQYDPSLLPTIEQYYTAILKKAKTSIDMTALSQAQRFTAFSGLAISSGVALALNGILLVYTPSNKDLLSTSLDLHNQTLDLVAQSDQYLPMAASWIPIALEYAWVAQPDPTRRAAIQQAWEKHWTPHSHAPFGISSKFLLTFDALRTQAALAHAPIQY